LINPEALHSLSVAGEYNISAVKVPKFFIGKKLQQTELKEKFHLTLIAVVRLELDIDTAGNPLNKEVVYEPDDSGFELQTGDTLFLLGTDEKIADFRSI